MGSGDRKILRSVIPCILSLRRIPLLEVLVEPLRGTVIVSHTEVAVGQIIRNQFTLRLTIKGRVVVEFLESLNSFVKLVAAVI